MKRCLGGVPDAPPDALWLAVSAPRATASSADLLTYVRGKWEADVAAGGIRDSFARLGYPERC